MSIIYYMNSKRKNSKSHLISEFPQIGMDEIIKNLLEENDMGMGWHFAYFPWESEKHYGEFLQQMLFIFQGTQSLFKNEDLMKKPIGSVFDEKLKEILELDLKVMGAKDKSENPMTRAVYQSQYFQMKKCAESYMGYSLCFEILAQHFYKFAKDSLHADYLKISSKFLEQSMEQAPFFQTQLLEEIKKSPNSEIISENFIHNFTNYGLFLYSIYGSPYQYGNLSED